MSSGSPFRRWAPRSSKTRPEPDGKVTHGAAGQHLARAGHRADPRSDVDGHAAPLVAALLAFADVHARADRDAVGGQRGHQVEAAPRRPSSDRRTARRSRRRCAWRGGRRTSPAPLSTSRSWSSSCRRQCSSPWAASSSVEPTMSVNSTVLSTRSAGARVGLLADEFQHRLAEEVQAGRSRSVRPAAVRAVLRSGIPAASASAASKEAMRSPLRPSTRVACGHRRARRGRRSRATASHIMRAIIGLADTRCSLPNISRTPGTSAIGPKNNSAKAPSPQWFSISS